MFITIEGGEGVGKSTQIKTIRDWLAARGADVVATREPGGTALAEAIRGVVKREGHGQVPPLSELLLMFAARISHGEEVIVPALLAGKIVLCDRYIDATYAYQGGGRGLDPRRIAMLEKWLPSEAWPDITILIDAPVEVGLERAADRGGADRFERESLDFFNRVRRSYLERADQCAERFIVIDAGRKSPRRVGEEIISSLDKRLARIRREAHIE
jgi:dTMP kinase